MKTKLLLFLAIVFGHNTFAQNSDEKISSKKWKTNYQTTFSGAPTSSNRNLGSPNNATVIYSQDFSGGIPETWTITNNAGLGEVFTWATTGPQTTPDSLLSTRTTAFNGYVIFNRGNGGQNGPVDCNLTTNAINCSGRTNVYLSIKEYFLQLASSTGTVSVSTDGINFTDVHSSETGLAQEQTTGNTHFVQVDISSIASNQATVYVRFKCIGNWDYSWMFDDLSIFEPASVDDAGVTASNLVSGCSLSSITPLTITINNFGGASIANIPVSFSVNGGTAVNEVAPGPIAPNGTYDYTFTATANLSTAASSTISFATALIGDANTVNDTFAVTVDNFTPVNLNSPYIMGFEPVDDLSAWAVFDGNGDGVTWAPANTFPYSGTQCIRKAGSGIGDDDWMWSRCLDMEIGKIYKLEYWYRQFDLIAPCSLEVKLATAQNVASSSQLIAVEVIDAIYHLSSNTFTVSANGSYYVAWHAFSNLGSSAVRVDLASIKLDCINTPLPTISTSGPLTFCNGGSVTLTSSSPTGNIWSNGSTTPSITVTNSGSYSVTVSNGICTVTSLPVNVGVNSTPATPTISTSGSTTLCTGGSVILTSSSVLGNIWSNGATSQSIAVTTAGSYSVSVSNVTCSSGTSIPITVIVNPIPTTPLITANGPTTFCSGGSVTLSSSSPTGNTWSNGSTAQSITVTNSGNYYVTVSNGTCIATSTQKTVVVNPTPTTPIISITGNVAFCDVDSVILTSNIASNIVWSNFATTQSIVVHSTGNYFVTTNNGLCSASSAPIAINVYATPPKPIITASGPTSFCSNGANFVTLSTSSSYLLNWFNLSTGITGNNTSTINVYTSGLYYVMATNYSGNAPICHTKSDTVAITTYGYPTVTTNPISQAASPNSNVQFSTMSNSTGVTYQWQENNGTGFTNITNGGQYAGATSATLTVSNVIKSQNNYQYRCVISNGVCDTNSNAAILTVYCIAPTVNLAGSNSYCQGTPVNLFATNGSGYTYQWYLNGTVIPGTTNANYSTLVAGNYSVRIDSGGCYGISPAQTVSFFSLPNVGISNSTGTVICSGSPVTLNGTGAVSYSWNNGINNNTVFYPTSTNTYQVIGTDIHGCTNVNNTTISVIGLPAVQSIIGNPSIVPFQNYIYGVNSTPGVSFNWLIQGGFIQSGQGANSVNVIWGSNGPYLLQLVQSNANGCSDTSSLAVINSNCSITHTVQQVGSAPYCQGDSITLSVVTAPGTQFQWLLNGAPINNAVNASVVATQSGVYQVQMTQAGCTALSNGNSISFLQAPATPIISASAGGSGCLGGTQMLTCASGYNGYIWSNGASTNSTIANNSGNFLVTVTGFNGCEATSAPFFVNLSLLSSADICLVSVDGVTNKNVVIWEKPVLTGVDSFYVYKESTSSNVYNKIGSLSANAFSTFTDNNSNPFQRADRYKISILDTCGFESSPSIIHKTIHLSVNQGVGNTYNLIWDAYEGFMLSTYYIMRGTTPNNLVAIDSIQSNLLSYTDLNPPAGTVYYAIEVRKAISCNPTARTSSLGYASSLSNIKDNVISSLNDYTNPFNSFTIIPNPATENTSINLNLSTTCLTNITVFDMTGRLAQILYNSLLTAGSHAFTWDLNGNNAKANAGIYFIKVSANGYTQTKRVVVL